MPPDPPSYLKICSLNAGNAISENQILKISWGHGDSAHTFGDCILSWAEDKEGNGPFGSSAPPLKNP